eukprot:GAHX01000697.1.p1 GENE.GAHX01000697.1~~GAHX01000697.1.p1  ORF type:complete len:178 (+),score=51.66 GAHX01000697.1:28-561(+)
MDKLRKFSFQKGNKTCFICKTPIPQYICTNYLTFVCKECAGMHRSLGLVVKSLTMNIIPDEQIDDIMKKGGNIKAAEKYLTGKFSIDDTPKISRPNDIKKYIYKVFIESEKELVDKKIQELEALKHTVDTDSDSETEKILNKQKKPEKTKSTNVFFDLINKNKNEPSEEEDDWDPFK